MNTMIHIIETLNIKHITNQTIKQIKHNLG